MTSSTRPKSAEGRKTDPEFGDGRGDSAVAQALHLDRPLRLILRNKVEALSRMATEFGDAIRQACEDSEQGFHGDSLRPGVSLTALAIECSTIANRRNEVPQWNLQVRCNALEYGSQRFR